MHIGSLLMYKIKKNTFGRLIYSNIFIIINHDIYLFQQDNQQQFSLSVVFWVRHTLQHVIVDGHHLYQSDMEISCLYPIPQICLNLKQ